MKKTYINPEIEIVRVAMQPLLAGSLPKNATEITSESDVLGHEDEFEW